MDRMTIDIDSPLVRTVNKITDLVVLNFWTLLCSIPIFTIGASFSAAHYVALKMRRDEESYTTREFFKAFKQNFKKATLIWLIMLFTIIVLAMDFYIIRNTELEIPKLVQGIIAVVAALIACTLTWLFPLQAKFENTIGRTIKNAFSLSMIQAPRTILMIIAYILPFVLCFSIYQIMPLYMFFGLSLPIYISAMLYNKMFKRLEDKILENMEEQTAPAEDEECIFSDVPLLPEDEKR